MGNSDASFAFAYFYLSTCDNPIAKGSASLPSDEGQIPSQMWPSNKRSLNDLLLTCIQDLNEVLDGMAQLREGAYGLARLVPSR